MKVNGKYAVLLILLIAGITGGVWAAETHSSTLTPGANESVSSVWVELENKTETTLEVYVGGAYDERLKDTDTATELNNATYSGNWTIDGDGESAVARMTPSAPPSSEVIVDDDWPTTTTKHVWAGDSAGKISSASDGVNRNIPSSGVVTVSTAAKITDGSSKQTLFVSENRRIRAQYDPSSGELLMAYYNNGGWTHYSTSTSIDASSWHAYTVTYDQSSGEMVAYVDGTEVMRKTADTGMTVGNAVYYGYNGAASSSDFYNPVQGYMDSGRVYTRVVSQSELAAIAHTQTAAYTAPAKTATNASQMSVSVPSVSDASVTVEAQGRSDGGSWVTIDSQSVSSSTTVSTDVSQLDYTEWRWTVTASQTGSSPSAEIGYTGVWNVSYVPATLVANKTVTPIESPSVTSVDIPGAYADEDSYTVEVTGQAPSSVGYSTTQSGGAVAGGNGATQPGGLSLTTFGLVGGLILSAVVFHSRRD